MFDLNCLMRPRKICLCRNVTREDIRIAVQEGAKSMAQLQAKTAASTGCGTCYSEVEKALKEELMHLQAKRSGQKELDFLQTTGFKSR